MDDEEFESLLMLINIGPIVKLPNNENLNEHDSLMHELEVYCRFDRSKLDDLYKNKETLTSYQKLALLNDYIIKGDSNQINKNEDKKEDDVQQDSTVLLKNIQSSETLKNNLNELTNFANNNYSLPSEIKSKKGELYEKVYNLNTSDIYGSYLSTLSSYYKQL